MQKVIITNEVTNKSYEVQKETIEELNAFIAYQKNKAKCPWGSLEKELIVAPSDYPDRAEFIEEVITQEPIFDENFEPVMVQDGNLKDEDGNDILDENGSPLPNMVQAFNEVTKHRVRIPQEFSISEPEMPDPTAENRALRDKILNATDWLFISDNPVPTAHRTYYKNYRQMLRDANMAEPTFRMFDKWLRDTQPQEFQDGGDAEAIIAKFNAYL